MGHHYPLNPQQQQQQPRQQHYQNQRNFLHAVRQPIYFDPSQQATRQPTRIVHRRPQFYQQQQPLYSQARPVPHAAPTPVLINPYGADYYEQPTLYDDELPAYNPHKFLTMARPLPANYEESGELLQDPYDVDQMSSYRQREFMEQQQQQHPEEYLEEAYYQVPDSGYCEDSIQQGAIMPHQQSQIELMNQQVVYAPARRRPPASPHYNYQHQQQHHNQAVANMRHIVRPQASASNYSRLEAMRARPSLSDEQTHRYGSRLMRPMHTISVQNFGQLAAQNYFGAEASELHRNSVSASSSSSLAVAAAAADIDRGQNLPPQNYYHDMMMNNGRATTATPYVSDETLLLALPNKSDQLNIDYGNEPFELQQQGQEAELPSSSILSEPNVIASPTSAIPRDAPDVIEAPATSPAAHRGELEYGQIVEKFSSNTYDCDTQRVTQLPLSSQGSRTTPMQPNVGAYENMAAAAAATTTNRKMRQQRLTTPTGFNNGDTRLLSNPKTNPQEYLDMNTAGSSGGNVSQDWLDTICGHLIEHMNNFGICVIDNFLGSIKGELILKEVHRLYSNGRYSKGRLVSSKLRESEPENGRLPKTTTTTTTGDDDSLSLTPPPSEVVVATVNVNSGNGVGPRQSQRSHQGAAADATGTIRSDRVIWVDGCEDGCAEINNLIQTLCSVITNSSRLSLYSNNGLDKVNINKRTKAHVACYPGNGTRYIKHVDNPNGDGRVITAIYYLNKKWNTKRDGGLLRMFPAGMDEVANIEPFFDRALFFWSDRRNPHEVLPSFRDRFAITVWYIGESRP